MNTYVYVPPRKSLLAFGVMCALLALALLAARSAPPTQPDGADSETQPRMTDLPHE